MKQSLKDELKIIVDERTSSGLHISCWGCNGEDLWKDVYFTIIDHFGVEYFNEIPSPKILKEVNEYVHDNLLRGLTTLVFNVDNHPFDILNEEYLDIWDTPTHEPYI